MIEASVDSVGLPESVLDDAPTESLEDAKAAKAEAAKARRAQRKAERAATPPPERSAVYDQMSLPDLRAARTTLTEEETRVSYWRRIIQARLDLVRIQQPDSDPVADLRRVLTDARTSVQRLANIDALPVDDVPPLPDLAEIWARQVDRDDAPAVARLETDLARAERDLSAFRRELHQRIDAITDELIARYREQPLLALQILPGDPLHRQSLTS
jgi:hypothetical protein